MRRDRPVRQAASPRPASTTRRSSGRAGSGRCTRRSCAGAAGLGRLARRQAEREWRTEYRRRHADVLVIGGGVAGHGGGAARCGARRRRGPGRRRPRARRHRARRRRRRARPGESAPGCAAAGSRCWRPAAALGFFDGIVPVWSRSTLHQIRADRHVAATGSIEQPLMFEGNDLPGVMLCSGARAARRPLRGAARGSTAVVATTGDRGLEAALALREAGGRGRSPSPTPAARRRRRGARRRGWSRRGSRCCAAAAVVRAFGRRRVKGAVLGDLDEAGGWIADTESAASTAIWSPSPGAPCPATSLLLQAGAKARWDEAARRLPARGRSPPGIHTAGRGRRPQLAATWPRPRARSRAPRRRSRSSSATSADQRPAARRPRGAERRPRPPAELVPAAASGAAARARQVLRLPLRGRDHRRHRLLDRRGLRLARAAEALHDGDHGALPGADVPARLDPADVRAHRDAGRRRSG